MALGTAETVFAQDVAGAANAFSRAQRAELAGDHESAAEMYELADGLVPSPEALRSALRARKAAGQLGSAALAAEKLLRRYPDDRRSRLLADATLEEAKRRFFRMEIRCPQKPCGVVLDGAAVGTEAAELHIVYIEAGDHLVSAAFGADHTEPQRLQARAGEKSSLTFDGPPERRIPPSGLGGHAVLGSPGASELGNRDLGTKASRAGLPPWILGAGAIVTTGLGAATLWSGLDVLQANDAYRRNQGQPDYDARAAYDEGRSKERRTNILIAATAVAGASTVVVALFTHWSSPEGDHLQVAAGASRSGADLSLKGSF